MTPEEQRKETPFEKFIAMLKGQKTRSEAHWVFWPIVTTDSGLS